MRIIKAFFIFAVPLIISYSTLYVVEPGFFLPDTEEFKALDRDEIEEVPCDAYYHDCESETNTEPYGYEDYNENS